MEMKQNQLQIGIGIGKMDQEQIATMSLGGHSSFNDKIVVTHYEREEIGFGCFHVVQKPAAE